MHAHVFVYAYACVYGNMYVHGRPFECVLVYAYVNVFADVDAYVYVYVYVYVYKD